MSVRLNDFPAIDAPGPQSRRRVGEVRLQLAPHHFLGLPRLARLLGLADAEDRLEVVGERGRDLLRQRLVRLAAELAPLGVTGEGADPAYPLVALDIGPGIDRAAAKRLLVEGQADGRWYYDEGCVDDEWRALG